MSPDHGDLLAAYERDGFVLAPSVFTPEEAATLRAESHAVLERLRSRDDATAAWKSVDAAGAKPEAKELRHCHDLHLHSAHFTRLLLDDRLVDLMALFLGTNNVQLHHSKMFVKPPRQGAPFPLHQDWPFFPHRDDSPMAAIIHLDDAPEEKGCVHAVAGSRDRGRLEHLGDTDWYLPPDTFAADEPTLLPAHAGDVLFFSYLTAHGSGPNVSDESRTTILVQFRDAHDVQSVDRHRSPGRGMMLRGTNVKNPPPPTSF